jgi:hypothetical protein
MLLMVKIFVCACIPDFCASLFFERKSLLGLQTSLSRCMGILVQAIESAGRPAGEIAEGS